MNTRKTLLETIKLEDGVFKHLSYHQERLDRTTKALWKETSSIHLADHLSVPAQYKKGVYKVRVIYGREIEKIEFIPYVIRSVKSLKLVHTNEIEYYYKYVDRSQMNALLATKGDCDDILIVKNGRLTDTSYTNIALFDGNHWYTPARPLMAGTCRARLLKKGKIIPADIYIDLLNDFKELRLINSMMDLEEGPRVAIRNIKLKNEE